MNTIQSTDYQTMIAESFEVLVDPKPPKHAQPVIGLLVDPRKVIGGVNGRKHSAKAEPFIMPMPYATAKEIAETMLRTLVHVAPELFTGDIG